MIYILSRDRLGLSVDKTTLKLIVDLMKVDSAEMEKELAGNSELRKRKEDLWRTLDQWRAITQLSSPDKVVMFEITQENMTVIMSSPSLCYCAICMYGYLMLSLYFSQAFLQQRVSHSSPYESWRNGLSGN